MTTRRSFLKTGTAGAVILAAGAAAWSVTRAPTLAREPWRAAGTSFGDARLDALAIAILAPNPHNMQPWTIRLVGDDALTLSCNLSRLLPETDPFNRQITVGFGCFLELLRQAGAEKGFALEIAPFPEGEPRPTLDNRPVAHVVFRRDETAKPDPLFAAALSRRTNRAAFRARAVPEATLQKIAAATVDGVIARTTADDVGVERLRRLAVEAWNVEWALARTRAESLAVTRIGAREIDRTPYGLALTSPMVDAARLVGAVTTAKMDDPESSAYEQSREFYAKAASSAAAFLSTSTATNSRLDQLNAGRAWVRFHQAATLEGVAFHPLSQALQEFPEMAAAYERAAALLAHAPGACVQMLARLGYANAPPPAPREPLTSKLTQA